SDSQTHWFTRQHWTRHSNPGSLVLGMAVGCNGALPCDPADCFRQIDLGLLSRHDSPFQSHVGNSAPGSLLAILHFKKTGAYRSTSRAEGAGIDSNRSKCFVKLLK